MSQASGSTLFIFPIYADRRPIPSTSSHIDLATKFYPALSSLQRFELLRRTSQRKTRSTLVLPLADQSLTDISRTSVTPQTQQFSHVQRNAVVGYMTLTIVSHRPFLPHLSTEH